MAHKILIAGQIGHSYNPDGTIAVKGVTVVDVASMIAIAPDSEELHVYINSPGGSVAVGEQIAELIKNVPNLKTIASEQCASIATIIHTSVPVQNRFVEQDCDYMIHAPLFINVSGNASELEYAAEQLKPIEAQLVDHYSKATGLTKNVIKPLMSAESHLTPEECVSLGFASAIIPKQAFEAVAFADSENVIFNNQIDMSNITDFQKKVGALAIKFGLKKPENAQANVGANAAAGVDGGQGTTDPRDAVALSLETDNGVILTPYSDIMVGDAVTLEDGTPAPDGVYTVADGTVITVSGGMVESFEIAEGSTIESVEMLAIIEAKDAEIAELKAQIVSFQDAEALTAQVVEKLEAKASRSSYVPKLGAAATFRPQGAGVSNTPGRISKEDIAARKASINQAK